MAHTDVLFFRDPNDSVPLLEWLAKLPAKVRAKCIERIDRLGELGHELRRPEADLLRDGIYELRASYQGVHYRMLYFFAGKAVVVVSHGLTKEQVVPPRDIDRAIRRRNLVRTDFEKFTFKPE
ncbi:MAG: type II toxin-antitoxin system RelE/ParE family toxin [Bryobacterales bacterium]|nr:type II toxin-antitoxin system RelE/ParE family toxin [Bryobacterales bacterium]